MREIIFSREFNKINIQELNNNLSQFINQYEKHYQKSFQKQIVKLFQNKYPEFFNLAQYIKKELLKAPFFLVVKGISFNSLEEEIRDIFILSLSSSIGFSTPTDRINKKVLWTVKADLDQSIKDLTFSQRLGEAEYHTDTQYFEYPEEILSLWCVKPDKDGGGVNGLISADYLISEIRQKVNGEKLIKTLTETKFPFKVPSVFTKSGNDSEVEIFLESILSYCTKIRFRRETIDKGCILGNISLTN